MKIFVRLFIAIIVCLPAAMAQTGEVESLIKQGITLHDKRDFTGAIELYNKALAIDAKSPLANYEIALSYFESGQYKKAIEHCEIVLDGKSELHEQAYILIGSSHDLLGDPDEAIDVYEDGLDDFPQSYMLYYNLGFTQYKTKEFEDAEESLQSALKINPNHASSHLLLANLMGEQGSRVKSLLALYNFLLLEPEGNRTASALKMLNSSFGKGITKEGDKKINIMIPGNMSSGDFGAAEMMLSIFGAASNLEKNKNKSEFEQFTSITESFFNLLMNQKKSKKGFYWNYYVDFFSEMIVVEHLKTFCYFVMLSKEDKEIHTWLEANEAKLKALADWYSGFTRKY